MDYALLAGMLAEYAALDDAAIAEALNANTAMTTRTISAAELVGWAIEEGAFVALEMASASDNLELRNLAKGALRIIDAVPPTGLDVTDERLGAFLTALIGAGVLAAGSNMRLLQLALVPTSPAALAGLGYVSPGDVALARGGVW